MQFHANLPATDVRALQLLRPHPSASQSAPERGASPHVATGDLRILGWRRERAALDLVGSLRCPRVPPHPFPTSTCSTSRRLPLQSSPHRYLSPPRPAGSPRSPEPRRLRPFGTARSQQPHLLLVAPTRRVSTLEACPCHCQALSRPESHEVRAVKVRRISGTFDTSEGVEGDASCQELQIRLDFEGRRWSFLLRPNLYQIRSN